MNIAVIGIGGVGGFFGGKLSQLLKNDSSMNISFVARGEHLREIQKNGLYLDTDDGVMNCIPSMATDRISDIPVPDLCLVCVKSFDLDNVLKQLKEKVSEKTILLPLLNGVDIYERMRSVIKTGVILPSCVYVGTHIEKPGMVIQRGGTCTIHFGSDPKNSYMNDEVFGLFKRAEIKYNWMDDPYPEIWSKYVFIGAFGPVTAAYDKTIGEVIESEELSGYAKSIMNEIVCIARRKNISLPESIADDSYIKGKKFPFETKTSFQRDYSVINKPDERDLFGGAVLRMGIELGVPTPASEFIFNTLQNNKMDIKAV